MWEIECTGDYGLSDCLFLSDIAQDYAEAWFTDPIGDDEGVIVPLRGTRPSNGG